MDEEVIGSVAGEREKGGCRVANAATENPLAALHF
jgi:hypothetical protein